MLAFSAKEITTMKKRLSQQGRCFICLNVGHVFKSCPKEIKRHIIIDVYVLKYITTNKFFNCYRLGPVTLLPILPQQMIILMLH